MKIGDKGGRLTCAGGSFAALERKKTGLGFGLFRLEIKRASSWTGRGASMALYIRVYPLGRGLSNPTRPEQFNSQKVKKKNALFLAGTWESETDVPCSPPPSAAVSRSSAPANEVTLVPNVTCPCY